MGRKELMTEEIIRHLRTVEPKICKAGSEDFTPLGPRSSWRRGAGKIGIVTSPPSTAWLDPRHSRYRTLPFGTNQIKGFRTPTRRSTAAPSTSSDWASTYLASAVISPVKKGLPVALSLS